MDSREHETRSHNSGDYFRILLPGKYSVTAKKEGYEPVQKTIVVKPGSDAVEMDFILEKSSSSSDPAAALSLAGGLNQQQSPQSDSTSSIDLQQMVRDNNNELADSSLLKQIQNIDQQLLSKTMQPNPENQFSPAVSLGIPPSDASKLNADEVTGGAGGLMHDFIAGGGYKDDEQQMNDFDLEKQDFFDQKTDLSTSDQA